jgi:hypothetical protein
LEPSETEYWRGWVAAFDYILTGSLVHDAKALEGIQEDETEPFQDYMAREPEE